ncbi:uncharacterized protein LOC121421793 [Lytechinus variegatus]|uniref:uncharacterized protein LOC121421793 n=1 Tax=Lytechinus variegatus TaxID=7654 RepID=UPI001BB14B4C|nr:uncharacterized protein LOC121421793 [Lytechinus variegatus]
MLIGRGNARGMVVWLIAVVLTAVKVQGQDTTPPNVTCSDVTTHPVFVNSFFGLTEGVSYTYEDANPDPSGISYNVTTGTAGDLYPPGRTPVTLIAVDLDGNNATCLFYVENTLTELPVNCPDLNRTVPTDVGQPTYSYTPAIGPGDVTKSKPQYRYHGAAVSVDSVIAVGTGLDVGSHVATIIIYDDVLNKTCSGYIVVQDTERPNVTCPENITESLTNVIDFSATAIDNVGASLVYQPDSRSRLAPGLTLVTVMAQDQAGLSDTCSFSVEITLTELPVECPDESTIQLDPSQSTYQYQQLTVDNLTLMEESYQFYGDVTIDMMINGTYNYTLSLGTYTLTIVVDDTVFNKTCSSLIRVRLKEDDDDRKLNKSPISTVVIVIVTFGAVLLVVFVVGCIVYQVKKTNARGKETVSRPETETINTKTTSTV